MMALIFLLFTLAMLLAYRGKWKPAIVMFIISLACCAAWFKYHITDAINIDL